MQGQAVAMVSARLLQLLNVASISIAHSTTCALQSLGTLSTCKDTVELIWHNSLNKTHVEQVQNGFITYASP